MSDNETSIRDYLDRVSELLWQHHHPEIAVALEAEVSDLLAELAAARAEIASLQADVEVLRDLPSRAVHAELAATRERYEAELAIRDREAREREEKLREALRKAKAGLVEAYEYGCQWPIGLDTDPQEQRGMERDTFIRNMEFYAEQIDAALSEGEG